MLTTTRITINLDRAHKLDSLHPRIELNIVADIIANGTARGAFRASSLIWTLVSKPATEKWMVGQPDINMHYR